MMYNAHRALNVCVRVCVVRWGRSSHSQSTLLPYAIRPEENHCNYHLSLSVDQHQPISQWIVMQVNAIHMVPECALHFLPVSICTTRWEKSNSVKSIYIPGRCTRAHMCWPAANKTMLLVLLSKLACYSSYIVSFASSQMICARYIVSAPENTSHSWIISTEKMTNRYMHINIWRGWSELIHWHRSGSSIWMIKQLR